MRMLILAITTFGVLGFVAPSVPARAEEKVIIKQKDHHDHPRFFDRFRRHDHDRKEVIIKKGGDHDHDHDH